MIKNQESKKRIDQYIKRDESIKRKNRIIERVIYAKQFETGTLLGQFELLPNRDQLEYLDKMVKKKYKTPRGDRSIGGYYECEYCAKADIFETGGYISEQD